MRMQNDLNRYSRIEWIDNVKGFAIITVILGHMLLPAILINFIYSFHMALFFVLAGYVINNKKEIKEFIVAKIRGILIPLMGYSFVLITFNFLYYCLILKNRTVESIINSMVGIFVQQKEGDFSSSLWFLPCLFVAEVIGYLIIKSGRYIKLSLVLCTMIEIIIYYMCKRQEILGQIPWCLDYVPITIALILVGYLLREESENRFLKSSYTAIYGVFFFLMLIVNNLLNGENGCLYSVWTTPFLTIFQAIAGSIFFMSVFRNIPTLKWLNYIGRNSLFYYTMHFIVFSITNIFTYNILNLNNDTNNLIKIIVAIVSLVIMLIILRLLNEIKIYLYENFAKVKEKA